MPSLPLMPRRLLLLIVLLFPLLGPAARSAPATPGPNNLLTQRYSADFLAAKMLPTKEWHMFPPAADRAAWDRLLATPLNQTRRAWLVPQAEALLGQPWPALPASLYMEYARTGNRSRYQAPYFQRRTNLATLVLAECMEHRGRFLDEMANGLWAISEEATWCIPAHAARGPGDVLHRQDLESVDLFAAETAMTLATARYLLHAELEKLSPALCDRIQREVLRRVVVPVETSDNFGRSGWLDGHNNWSPWCASNVLGAALLLIDDQPRLAKFAVRLMTVVDHFINRYGADGGCDEGPSYWNEAPGAMLVFLELLQARTQGAVDIYAEPKIAAMGEFIVREHIADSWYVNFSDADARTTPQAGKVYRYGERIHSAAMINLALRAQRAGTLDGPVTPPLHVGGSGQPLLGPLMEMFWIPAEAKPALDATSSQGWLPDLEVLVVRETNDPERGLFLAAKGGHNAENHNHNDTGHFIVYLDGQPGIIDLGREEYTAKTFSLQRYDLLCNRGRGHNAPTVNGVEQAAGREFKATQLAYARDAAGVHLAMNLEQAFPAVAGLQTLRREIEYHRNPQASIRVRDSFVLKSGPANLLVPLYAARPAELVRPGLVAIACQPRRLLLEFDPAVLTVKIEPVPIEDPSLRRSWGKQLWRVALEYRHDQPAGDYELRLRAEQSR